MSDPRVFLNRPGLPGPFGALMDEYARAAAGFCDVIEMVPRARFMQTRESADPNTTSIRAVCAHAIGAAHRYSDYIRKRRGLAFVERFEYPAEGLSSPDDVRPRLAEALQYTEEGLEGLYDAPDAEVAALTFQVRWGPTYDPEMILEHAIVHLLRHRRQIERWS